MSRSLPRFSQTDATRATRAAMKAGVRDFRIDIAPDGTISIIVGSSARLPARPNSCDDLLR